jgi:hypothetical protein
MVIGVIYNDDIGDVGSEGSMGFVDTRSAVLCEANQ